MRLPERIDTETELENILAEPSDADLACVARLTGDVLILGAGGKMGPSLARRVQRAVIANRQHLPCDRRIPLLVSRRAHGPRCGGNSDGCVRPARPRRDRRAAALSLCPFSGGPQVWNARSNRHHLGDQHGDSRASGRALLSITTWWCSRQATSTRWCPPAAPRRQKTTRRHQQASTRNHVSDASASWSSSRASGAWRRSSFV